MSKEPTSRILYLTLDLQLSGTAEETKGTHQINLLSTNQVTVVTAPGEEASHRW